MSDAVPADLEELLDDEAVVAHLATSTDDRPHVAPVWFRYDDGTVELMTTGRKLANVEENPRVALSVHRGSADDPDWTATLFGTATVVDDEATAREANRRINLKYGAEEDDWADNTLVRVAVGSASLRRY